MSSVVLLISCGLFIQPVLPLFATKSTGVITTYISGGAPHALAGWNLLAALPPVYVWTFVAVPSLAIGAFLACSRSRINGLLTIAPAVLALILLIELAHQVMTTAGDVGTTYVLGVAWMLVAVGCVIGVIGGGARAAFGDARRVFETW